MSQFNWLHISDLHFGAERQNWLWPNFKPKFLEDVDSLLRDMGQCHAVVFSGDVAQSGSKEQFRNATSELESLWEVLRHHGNNPPLICIPGNHDLVRPESLDPVGRSLRDFAGESDLREEFWANPDNQYLQGTKTHFQNFLEWYDLINLPKPTNFHSGYVPGDFSCTVEIPGLVMGFVGLNTAFLHLSKDAKAGTLSMHERQIVDVCRGDPIGWCGENSANMLVTHHGIDWLDPECRKAYDNEIAPPGRFLVHMYGHMHSPTSRTYSEAGAVTRRFWQAPSVFGLEKCNNGSARRLHGYSFGSLTVANGRTELNLTPRILHEAYGGGSHIVADNGYRLNTATSVIEALEELTSELQHSSGDDTEAEQSANRGTEHAVDQLEKQIELLEASPTVAFAREKLCGIPRLKHTSQPELRRVRQEQQSDMESLLIRDRCVWIAADWGLGVQGFIASVCTRLDLQTENLEKFEITFEDVTDRDSFLAAAQSQLGLSFQAFCTLTSALPKSLIVLTDVPEAIADTSPDWLDGLLRSIKDYCPGAFIVPTTRSVPAQSQFKHIRLLPMSMPDVGNYISDHPDGGPDMATLDTAELLHLRSGGLPMHLDRLLRELKYGSIHDLIDEELDFSEGHEIVPSEPIPKSLVNAVGKLSASKEKYSPRSMRMLKVLTVLSSGATLNTIKRFYPTEPFWSCNPEELVRMGLLNVVPLTTVTQNIGLTPDDGGSDEATFAKLLVVPRQVRDFVRTLISPQEKLEIVQRGAELFFGAKWREGKLVLRPEIRMSGAQGATSRLDNEHTIACHLAWDATERENIANLRRAARLGVAYCNALEDYDRFRDAVYSTEELLHLLDTSELRKEISGLLQIRGRTLRMLGRYSEALEVFQRNLNDYQDVMSKDEVAGLHMSIALLHHSNNDDDEAAAAAITVREMCDSGSARYIHATAIVYETEFTGSELTAKLSRLEKQARNKGYSTVANNIALTLADTTANLGKKLALQNRVIASAEDAYNRIRATIRKAEAVVDLEGQSSLTAQDRGILSAGYSYLHAQRMGSLFNQCHAVVWRLLRSENRIMQLLRLFRHSSFLWRLRGQNKTEKKYLDQLSGVDMSPLTVKGEGRTGVIIEIRYLDARRIEQGANVETDQSG